MNLASRRRLGRGPLTGTWYRAVRPEHLATALGHEHTTVVPGRFTAGEPGRPGAAVLYLAEAADVALAEVGAILRGPHPSRTTVSNPTAGIWAVVPVRVVLSGVVDLSNPTQLDLIDTTEQELTGDWLGYRERPHFGPRPPLAPTQQLGAALFKLPRVEGFLTYSAKNPTRRNLIVFPTKLRPGSTVAVVDPATGDVLLSLP